MDWGTVGAIGGAAGYYLGEQMDTNENRETTYNDAIANYPAQYKAAVSQGIKKGEDKATSLYGSGESLPGEYQDLKKSYLKSASGRGPEADRIKSLYNQEGANLRQSQQQSGIKGSLAQKQQMEQERAGSFAAEEAAVKSRAMATDRYAKMLGGEISDRATISMGYGQLYGAGMQPPMPKEQKGLLSELLGGLI